MTGPARREIPNSTPAATASGVFSFCLLALLLLPLRSSIPGGIVQEAGIQTARWSRTLVLAPGGHLDLVNISGSISVQRASGRQVRLTALKRVALPSGSAARTLLDAITIEIATTDSSAAVRVSHPAAGQIRQVSGREPEAVPLGVSFEIALPRDLDVSITTGSGDIVTRDTGGEVQLETRSGNVTVTDAAGIVEAGSMQGDIRIERAAGVRYVNTVSGGIVLSGIRGAIKATCVSGDIEIRGGTPRMVEASSTGGGIRWEGAVPPGSSFVLSSHSGTIEFIAGPSPGFAVNLSTVAGTIIAPLELVPTGASISRRSVTGTWGEPQARVALTAFSGDIILTIHP